MNVVKRYMKSVFDIGLRAPAMQICELLNRERMGLDIGGHIGLMIVLLIRRGQFGLSWTGRAFLQSVLWSLFSLLLIWHMAQ